jgi:hypothetical protein
MLADCEVDVHEFVYYEDENVRVTSKQVKLGDKVFLLRDVRFVGVVRKSEAGRVQRARDVVLRFALIVLAYLALFYLLSLISLPGWLLSPAHILLIAGPFLISWYESRLHPYGFQLSIRLPDRFEIALNSADKKYLENVAKIVNDAIVKDRKAQRLRQPNSGVAQY